ncbi:beta-lactamase family protein [Streptacidiphilus sp. P02-A3a]|nr:beta-lactamase family protein [Streptacidiphilus sp. P02-A3a]
MAPLLDAAPEATGTALAAVRADQRLLLCGGSTARTGGRPVDPDTRFEIGSLSKTFTALLLAESVARGEVRYDDPIGWYLPAGATPGHRGGEPITLLHLATHTAGLPRLPSGLLATAVPTWSTTPYGNYSQARLLRSLGATRVRARPGARVHYSNLGVGLLGLLLARAAGTDYPALLDDRVCRPLGLTRTGCDPGPGQATGYWHGRPRPPWLIPALPGAGAVRSSARDLLRYLEALLDPDRAGALGPALAEVRRPRLLLPRTGDGLCLVWNLRPRPGHDLLFHSGGTRGFTAFVGFCPRTRTGLAALANTTPPPGSRFIQDAYSAFRALADPAGAELSRPPGRTSG